jgi:hypothetical protein
MKGLLKTIKPLWGQRASAIFALTLYEFVESRGGNTRSKPAHLTAGNEALGLPAYLEAVKRDSGDALRSGP